MNTYCPLPFKHVFVEPRGIKPCCSYTSYYDGSIQDWLVSKELAEIQQQFLNNQVPHGCKRCIAYEKINQTSTRLGALHDYPDLIATDTDIDYVDYRSSNICNFKCRSCEPFYSNGIALEARRNEQLLNFYSVPPGKLAPTTVEDKKWVIDNIENIKRLMFTGGEPTKIPDVREIIDHIIDNNHSHVNIMITTNCSFKDPYWTEITKNIKNIHWTMSLDAVGPPAEIIRHGTVWQEVNDNIELMFDISPSVNIGTVITNLNLFHLKELFEYANSMYKKYQHRPNGKDQLIEICNWPVHLRPSNLSPELAIDAIKYLNSIPMDTLQPKQKLVVQNLLDNFLDYQFDPENWKKFQEYNSQLDKIRDQDHTQLITAYKYPAKEDIIHASK